MNQMPRQQCATAGETPEPLQLICLKDSNVVRNRLADCKQSGYRNYDQHDPDYTGTGNCRDSETNSPR